MVSDLLAVVDQLDVVIGLVSLGDDDLIRCVMNGGWYGYSFWGLFLFMSSSCDDVWLVVVDCRVLVMADCIGDHGRCGGRAGREC